MSWIYYKSVDNKYRYAIGEIQDNPNKLLFCFGVNPSTATPQKLDPTVKRIEKIAKEHGYDSWIILNLCAQRSTDPDEMKKTQSLLTHQENIKIIATLLNEYRECSDILFAYGDLIAKRKYLKNNLYDIVRVIKSITYSGGCYCLGKTKSGNARHPLYQKTNTPFVSYLLDDDTCY